MIQTTDAPISTFGQRLQRCRKAQKIGAERLAELVNEEYGEGTTTRSVITAIETGRKLEGVTLAEVLRFAHVLGVSPLCLMIDLEQPFLRADFPGFEGLYNYQAMRRFNGYVIFDMPVPEFMKKAQRIGRALDNAVRYRANVIKKLKKLKDIEELPEYGLKSGEDYDEEEGEYGPNAAERAKRLHVEINVSMWDDWTYLLEERETLATEGVIFPVHAANSVIVDAFTDAGLEQLRREVAPYEVKTGLNADIDWGDSL